MMPKLTNHDAGFFCLSWPVATEDKVMAARYYKTPHAYYCGVDLHARRLFVHLLDDKGVTHLQQDLPASLAPV